MRPLPWLAGAAALVLAGCQQVSDPGTAVADDPAAATEGVPTLASADADMRAVLLAFQALGPKPIETLSTEEARRQPTAADAVKKVLGDRGEVVTPDPVANIRDVTFQGRGGALPARIYTPDRAAPGMVSAGTGPLPVIVYFHGGGWVIADIDTYDASARALANETGAIIVSAEYHHGPEHRFPAAHDDAYAAYEWALRNARSFGGDPGKVAVAGESAGGSLAIGVSRTARQYGLPQPAHQLLVYPVAGSGMNTPSYQENGNAKPLNKAMMDWFFRNDLRSPADRANPLIDVVNAPDLAGLPSTTIITAEIDPLRSEGQELASRLRAAGVPVSAMDYEGVTHEFFGVGAAVAKAADAVRFAATQLRAAFATDGGRG